MIKNIGHDLSLFSKLNSAISLNDMIYYYTRILKNTHAEFVFLRHLRFLCTQRQTHNDFPTVNEILSAESKVNCIKGIKLVKVSQRELTEENKKRAAVLIPLCLVKNDISLLYTLRTSELKRHRGQVSFPGGMEDHGDSSLEETALRETEEEIGIRRGDVELWGSGNIYVGKEFSVLPVIGYLGEVSLERLRPNPDEVELAFTIPLKHFCDLRNCKYTQFRYMGSSYILPVYINTEYRIWGITALITHIALSSLLPRHYSHKLQYIRPIVSMQNV